jgi:flavin-dependent dehydrogenase
VRRFDVAIVGAGPAGSSAAIFLARKGYSVVLLDKSVFPRAKLCGDFLNPVNWEIFERLGIQNALLSVEHEKVQKFRLSASSVEAMISLSGRSGKCAFGLGLQRALFDDLLLKLAEGEGVAVGQGCRLKHLSRERSGWSLTWEDFSAEEGVHSTLLIGADGRNSWVAHQLGLAGPAERSGRFVAFQLHLRGCRGINGEVQIHLFPGGYAGLVGLGGGMANLCFTVEKEKVRERPTIDALFERCLYKNLYLRAALEDSDVVGDARSVYPVYFSPRRCYGDGFLLAGDASRVTEPVTGEGVYFALRSGELAAQAVDAAFKKENFSALQLSSYDFACRKALSRRQRINGLIRAVIHRPHWLKLLVRLSSKGSFPISTLVHLVCQPSR